MIEIENQLKKFDNFVQHDMLLTVLAKSNARGKWTSGSYVTRQNTILSKI
jgi:hypothetical protein